MSRASAHFSYTPWVQSLILHGMVLGSLAWLFLPVLRDTRLPSGRSSVQIELQPESGDGSVHLTSVARLAPSRTAIRDQVKVISVSSRVVGAEEHEGVAPRSFAGGSVDLMKSYLETVRSRIHIRSQETTGRVQVRLRIGAGGMLDGVELVEASAAEALNREALAAVERAGPFPPPPLGATEKGLTAKVWLDFRN